MQHTWGFPHRLLDVGMGGASTTDADADVIIGEILLGNLAQLWFEGGREEQIMVIGIFVGVCHVLIGMHHPGVELPYLHRT